MLERVFDRHKVTVVEESGETLEGQVVQAILERHPTVSGEEFVYPGVLAADVMRARVGDVGWEELRPGHASFVAPQSVTKVLRHLGLKRQGRDGIRGARYLLTATAHRSLLQTHGPTGEGENATEPHR